MVIVEIASAVAMHVPVMRNPVVMELDSSQWHLVMREESNAVAAKAADKESSAHKTVIVGQDAVAE